MARIVKTTRPVLTVTLSSRLGLGWSHARADAEQAEFWGLVKRHVLPHYDGSVDVEMTFDDDPVCSHCGYRWTEDSPDYNGGCCAADQDAQDKAEASLAASEEAADRRRANPLEPDFRRIG